MASPAEHAATVRQGLSIGPLPDSLVEREELDMAHDALDALAARADELARDRDEWKDRAESSGQWRTYRDERDAAEARVDELERALRFYANEDDYLWHGDKRGIIQKNDRGAVARAALGEQP